jgi:hypothetical protein
MLLNGGMLGEPILHTDGNCYMLVREMGTIHDTLHHGDWLFEREDGRLCFLSNEDFESKYRKTVDGWFDVKDRLPRISEKVLIFTPDGIDIGYIFKRSNPDTEFGWALNDRLEYAYGVTHWKHLPLRPNLKANHEQNKRDNRSQSISDIEQKHTRRSLYAEP